MPKHEAKALIASIRISPLATVVTDPALPDNPIIAVNRSFELLTGYQQSDLLGVNCRILSGKGTDRHKSSQLGVAVEMGTSVCVELLNYRKDGSSFINAVMIAPILNENGQPGYYVGTQMEVLDGGNDGRSGAVSALAELTPKQRTVLKLMVRGMRSRQIAVELGLTEKTIRMHRVALVRRLNLASTMEAVRLAVQAKL
ncbi:LuxR C-terminal-related transcriptional regulator [Sphingomonas sp. PB2P12]|uniref:response regulator transcription factor n=1 Tax=Sphingomonas sandaracina TaxID=3096157 RepID=UPI002FC651E4